MVKILVHFFNWIVKPIISVVVGQTALRTFHLFNLYPERQLSDWIAGMIETPSSEIAEFIEWGLAAIIGICLWGAFEYCRHKKPPAAPKKQSGKTGSNTSGENIRQIKTPSQHPVNVTSNKSDKKEAPIASARLQFDAEKNTFFVIETKGIKSLILHSNKGIIAIFSLPTINMVFNHENGPYEIKIHTSEGSGNYGGSFLGNCIGYLIQENKDAFVSICPKASQLVLLTSHEVTFNFYRKA